MSNLRLGTLLRRKVGCGKDSGWKLVGKGGKEYTCAGWPLERNRKQETWTSAVAMEPTFLLHVPTLLEFAY